MNSAHVNDGACFTLDWPRAGAPRTQWLQIGAGVERVSVDAGEMGEMRHLSVRVTAGQHARGRVQLGACPTRIEIELAAAARLHLVLDCRDAAAQPLRWQRRVMLGEGSTLQLGLHLWQQAGAQFEDEEEISLDSAARLEHTLWLEGAGSSQWQSRIGTRAADAQVHSYGLFDLHGDARLSYARDFHAQQGGTSHERLHTLLDDRADAALQSRIDIPAQARSGEAEQIHRHLLLSEGAHARSMPHVALAAHMLPCRHAVSVAHPDPQALRYLHSRGVPDGDAHALLKQAFAQAALSRWPVLDLD